MRYRAIYKNFMQVTTSEITLIGVEEAIEVNVSKKGVAVQSDVIWS